MNKLSYSELVSSFVSYEDRLNYLAIPTNVGESTLGGKRLDAQSFYHSRLWRETKRKVILRDNGCDLAVNGLFVHAPIVHHINPITTYDLESVSESLFNLDNLVLTSRRTHDCIHFGSNPITVAERYPGDTDLYISKERRIPVMKSDKANVKKAVPIRDEQPYKNINPLRARVLKTVNFRTEPSGSIIRVLQKDEIVDVVEHDYSQWTKIRTLSNPPVDGYVMTEFLAEI